jgi:hypothetical protein
MQPLVVAAEPPSKRRQQLLDAIFVPLVLVFFWSLFFGFNACGRANQPRIESREFCACLGRNDVNCVRELVNSQLTEPGRAKTEEELLAVLQASLLKSSCIKRADLDDATLTSIPPRRAFYLVTDKGQFTLLISYQSRNWVFDQLIRQ